MSDVPMQSPEPDDDLGLPASYSLTDSGWEPVDLVEPAADWRVLPDGSYESPDGTTRTRLTSDPVEWSDTAGE